MGETFFGKIVSFLSDHFEFLIDINLACGRFDRLKAT